MKYVNEAIQNKISLPFPFVSLFESFGRNKTKTKKLPKRRRKQRKRKRKFKKDKKGYRRDKTRTFAKQAWPKNLQRCLCTEALERSPWHCSIFCEKGSCVCFFPTNATTVRFVSFRLYYCFLPFHLFISPFFSASSCKNERRIWRSYEAKGARRGIRGRRSFLFDDERPSSVAAVRKRKLLLVVLQNEKFILSVYFEVVFLLLLVLNPSGTETSTIQIDEDRTPRHHSPSGRRIMAQIREQTRWRALVSPRAAVLRCSWLRQNWHSEGKCQADIKGFSALWKDCKYYYILLHFYVGDFFWL